MPLTDDQHERLTLILDGLGAVRGQLYERARTFVDDQIARHAKYGQSMFLSPKQSAWLTDLYEEHVGVKPETVSQDDEDHALTDKGMDDEIPF